MSNKKTLIISILTMLSIVILVVGGILFALNNKEKTMQENMKMIKSDYANFSNNITDNEKIRKQLAEHISEFKNNTFKDEQGKYEETLKKYDKNIKYIDTLIKDLESRCKYEYEDKNTNILCKGFGGLYETTVNKYVAKVKAYNNLITQYNKTASSEESLYKAVYDNFIDYDKDGKYNGSN